MLSAVVLVDDSSAASPDAIVRTLASLVPAAIEGIVRDVILAAAASSADLRHIADHAGCELAEAGTVQQALQFGIKSARNNLIFVLRAGYAPEPGFADEIAETYQRSSRPRALCFRQQPESFATRLMPGFASVQAIVAERAALAQDARDFASLVRKAGRSPTARARLRNVD